MKYDRKQIEIICDTCGITFLRAESEVKRNFKKNKKSYCSRSCFGKSSVPRLRTYKPDVNFLVPDNRKDQFTPFRGFLRNINSRGKEKTITLEDIKNIWEKQGGKCIYSGVDLILPDPYQTKRDPIYGASADRIDSSKGYTKDNVQFVSVCMNHMKNSMSHENMIKIINIIKNN